MITREATGAGGAMKPRPRERATPILAPVDFSDSAAIGLDWAVAIARDRRLPLRLIHALPPAVWPVEYSAPRTELVPEIERRASARLERTVAEIGRAKIDASFEIRPGRPSDVVLDVARECGAKLVVIATRGHAGLDHVLLGSTTERIVRRAPCPVFTIPGSGTSLPRSARRVLVATDFTPESRAAAEAVLDLLADGSEGGAVACRMLLLHAYEVPYELGAEGTVSSAAAASELCGTTRCHALCRLEAMAEELRRPGVEVEIDAVEGSPSEVILDRVRTRRLELVAMGTHGRAGLRHALLGSTAERVVRRSTCPVLTVRHEIGELLAAASGRA